LGLARVQGLGFHVLGSGFEVYNLECGVVGFRVYLVHGGEVSRLGHQLRQTGTHGSHVAALRASVGVSVAQHRDVGVDVTYVRIYGTHQHLYGVSVTSSKSEGEARVRVKRG
jgi:hypothetical protein